MGRGETAISLAFLNEAARAADLLEEVKAPARRGDENASDAMLLCERTLDEAWGMVAAIERNSGPLVADMCAEHWLMGRRWHDVAASHGIAPDKCKKLAYEAVRALDEQ